MIKKILRNDCGSIDGKIANSIIEFIPFVEKVLVEEGKGN
jgi:hypothetical protein